MIDIDSNNLDKGNDQPYGVNYVVFNSDAPALEIDDSIEELNISHKGDRKLYNYNACFSALRDHIIISKNIKDVRYNRTIFKCDRLLDQKIKEKDKEKYPHLTDDEIKLWFKLCVENNLCPEVNKSFFSNDCASFDTASYSMPKVYIHLCVVRHIQENPWFIRNVLRLMSEHKLGFFSALSVSSMHSIRNEGHHFMNTSLYGGIKSKGTLNVTGAVKLYGFVNSCLIEPQKFLKFCNTPSFFGLDTVYNSFGPERVNALAMEKVTTEELEDFIMEKGKAISETINKKYLKA